MVGEGGEGWGWWGWWRWVSFEQTSQVRVQSDPIQGQISSDRQKP